MFLFRPIIIFVFDNDNFACEVQRPNIVSNRWSFGCIQIELDHLFSSLWSIVFPFNSFPNFLLAIFAGDISNIFTRNCNSFAFNLHNAIGNLCSEHNMLFSSTFPFAHFFPFGSFQHNIRWADSARICIEYHAHCSCSQTNSISALLCAETANEKYVYL